MSQALLGAGEVFIGMWLFSFSLFNVVGWLCLMHAHSVRNAYYVIKAKDTITAITIGSFGILLLIRGIIVLAGM